MSETQAYQAAHDPEKMTRKELVSDIRHCWREQEEYEAKLAQAQELYRKAVSASHDAFGPVADTIGMKLGESWTDDAPGKAAEWIKRAQARIAELEATNQQVRKYAERIRGMLPTNRGGMMDGDTREIIVTLDRIITILDGKEGGGGVGRD